jgi:hypothetical protein
MCNPDLDGEAMPSAAQPHSVQGEKVDVVRRLREGDVSIPAGRVQRDQALLLADGAAAGTI